MANAAATAEAVEIALATSTLGVGCHVVLVDGDPVLPASEIAALVDPATGRFFPTLGKFLKHIYASLGRRAEIAAAIEAEAFAQISRLKSKGVRLTHLDTHKHTHMFPPVLDPVLRAAVRAGVERIRNPFEPQWSVAATPGAPAVRRLQVRVLRSFESGFGRRVAAAGLQTTDGAPGVLRAWVGGAEHDPAKTRGDDGVRAGSRPSVGRAGLERHVERRPGAGLPSQRVDGHPLRVGTAVLRVKALRHDPPVLDNDGPDHRVGKRPTPPVEREFQGLAHEGRVVA